MPWEAVVGLEIHAQLATRTKIFSGAPAIFGAEPNRQACAIDLGLPGVLPVLNQDVLRMAVLFGLATNSRIASPSVFARKNYFYPDLPKGYQISQYELPIVQGGAVKIRMPDGSSKTIRITRAHLEEDAGKSVHEAYPGETGVDLNRAGVPLLEIVSAPDMRSPEEATEYMRTIHTLVRYLRICDGNMQEGSFRCDANVSIRPLGETTLGTRTEIKNLNSFRFVGRAIAHEIDRQIDILENNGTITQETRNYDVATGQTRPMRQKEEANDYRYFPDPDLLPIEMTPEFIERIRHELPELPQVKMLRFRTEYGSPKTTPGNLHGAANSLTTTRQSPRHLENQSCPPIGLSANLPLRYTAKDSTSPIAPSPPRISPPSSLMSPMEHFPAQWPNGSSTPSGDTRGVRTP